MPVIDNSIEGLIRCSIKRLEGSINVSKVRSNVRVLNRTFHSLDRGFNQRFGYQVPEPPNIELLSGQLRNNQECATCLHMPMHACDRAAPGVSEDVLQSSPLHQRLVCCVRVRPHTRVRVRTCPCTRTRLH